MMGDFCDGSTDDSIELRSRSRINPFEHRAVGVSLRPNLALLRCH